MGAKSLIAWLLGRVCEAKNLLCLLGLGDYSVHIYGYCYEKHYAYDYGDASQSFLVDEQVCSSIVCRDEF
jgi:hypothetical protein